MIHRDVKPENLMVERGTGRVIVTDFGVARDTRASTITRDGWILGSVHYMSPEQAAGDQLDGRSDLYALGIIGWQALSGRLPFEAEQASAVLMQHATRQAPSLQAAAPDVPRQVAAVIERCLAKIPDDRFPTGEALAEALTAAWEAAQREPAPTPPPRWPFRRSGLRRSGGALPSSRRKQPLGSSDDIGPLRPCPTRSRLFRPAVIA